MPYYQNEMHLFGKNANSNLCSVLFCSELTSTYKMVSFNNLNFVNATVYTRAKRETNTIYWYGYVEDASDERAIFNTVNSIYYYFAF